MFTGLRVGVAAGKALAHARRLPMIGVTSLDLLAFPLRSLAAPHRVRAIDAGRGEIFYASLPPGARRRAAAHRAPGRLARRPRVRAAGRRRGGAPRRRRRPPLPRRRSRASRRVELADRGVAYPSAGSLVQLAHARALREEFVSPGELTPLYLRKPDAEINWATRDGARA